MLKHFLNYWHQLALNIKFLIIFYSIILLSLSAIGYYGYQSASQAYQEKSASRLSIHTQEIGISIDSLLSTIPKDLSFFSQFYALKRFLYWQDIGNDTKKDYWQVVTNNSFQAFVASQDIYYKIRYMDTKGLEKIKARFDRPTGKVEFESGKALQDKRHMDYFQKTMQLTHNEAYVSDLNLNMEFGKIENPKTKVIRFSQPVIGDNQVNYGVIILNLFADAFLHYLSDAIKTGEGRRFYLSNKIGSFLFHPDKEKEFSHLLGHSYTMDTEFPNLMAQINQQEQGNLFYKNNLVSFRRIYPDVSNRSHYWILFGLADKSLFTQELQQFQLIFFTIIASILLLAHIISKHFFHSILSPLNLVTQRLNQLARGELVKESLYYSGKDEIRQMLNSVEQLTVNLENVSSQTDIIASGDFSKSVKLLSEQDRLGIALNNMTHILLENHSNMQQQNWIRDGVSHLNRALAGEQKTQALMNKAISEIGHYLHAGKGVLYLYQESEQTLNLLASYMYNNRDQLANSIKLGEGAVGQTALEQKKIILQHSINDTNPSLISTGTVCQPALITYTIPLIRDNTLLGVLELACNTRYSPIEDEYLQAACNTIASFLFSSLQNDKIQGLLEVSEAATLEAKDRTFKLQEVNTQMEEQQQLQQQTEELSQANSQMEEQQQQMKQQAAELKMKNKELEASQVELTDKAGELEQSSQYKTDFLANMSHELRTPLNSIILLSKMMYMNELKTLAEDDIKRAEVIHSAGQELLRLINDILDLSKIESGKIELVSEAINSQYLCQEMRDLFQDIAQQQKIEFKIDNQLDISFNSDRDKLSQILRNLLSNALKFTKQGHVLLSISQQNDSQRPIMIKVTDTGIGIPVDKQNLIFKAFQQVDSSISREYGGTGLGLSISRRLIDLLGGRIELQSQVDQGSTFSLSLPMALPSASQQPLTALGSPEKTQPIQPIIEDRNQPNNTSTTQDTQLILVIDDDPTVGSVIEHLNKTLGYKTLIATTGEAGYQLAEQHLPNGILLDLGLPDIEGTEILQRLKQNPALKHIPVSIISARDPEKKLFDLGITGYLQKPFDEQQLTEAQQLILQQTTQEHNNKLLFINCATLHEELTPLMTSHHLQLFKTDTIDSSISLIDHENITLIILAVNQSVLQETLKFCATIRGNNPDIALIIYISELLSDEDIAHFRRYTDSVIIKDGHYQQRLINNIERFLNDIKHKNTSNTAPLLALDSHNNTPALSNIQILVVDDDPRNLFVITSALEQHGANVDTALNGAKALSYLAKNIPDLILMDIMMPEMNGYEAIQKIKQNEQLKDIPIIVLTAKALTEDRNKALEMGANDYLVKPIDYEVLINMVHVWTANKA